MLKHQIFNKYVHSESLATYDPYDIWKTKIGFFVKDLFNKNRKLALLPAAFLTLLDLFVNPVMRLFYKKQEYPIVRAQAAITLINIFKKTGERNYLKQAREHIDWLVSHSSKGFSGRCWGLGFTWPAGDGLIYDANTPFTTHTPYVLETLHLYIQASGDDEYKNIIKSIYNYYENDVKILFDKNDCLGVSYGPMEDRLITNAVAYTLYAYSIFYHYLNDQYYIQQKCLKLFQFLKIQQRNDGSWLYEPFNDATFIDCFHSCFVVKNILKASKLVALDEAEPVIDNGYRYIKKAFFDEKKYLMVRFSLSNKPSVVKYDLYDNAEMLNLAVLCQDVAFAEVLQRSIDTAFLNNESIYSMVDFLGVRRNKNTLRWAVMPYLHALSVWGLNQ